jgi:hypothetical protein
MRPALLALLLASSLAFGQKFQDITAKGAPVSLTVKHDRADVGPYVAVRNLFNKGILAYVAVTKITDERGQTQPCESWADYAFKPSVLGPQEENPLACPLDLSDPLEPPKPAVKITDVVSAVLFVQFEDGTTWGDLQTGKRIILDDRPKKLAFLKRLVETYYESGEDAFNAMLSDQTVRGPEVRLAMHLKGDAEYQKTSAIDLVKKQLAPAQGWHASGIF